MGHSTTSLIIYNLFLSSLYLLRTSGYNHSLYLSLFQAVVDLVLIPNFPMDANSPHPGESSTAYICWKSLVYFSPLGRLTFPMDPTPLLNKEVLGENLQNVEVVYIYMHHKQFHHIFLVVPIGSKGYFPFSTSFNLKWSKEVHFKYNLLSFPEGK